MMGGGNDKRKYEEENMENSMKRIKISQTIPELPPITISTRSNYSSNYTLGQLVQQRRRQREEGMERAAYVNYESINKQLGDLHHKSK
jgi:hypothetical protein